MSSVSHLTVRGFKSIASLERFELGSLNVLIGPNGAGKSNLLDLFRMFGAMASERLRLFVAPNLLPRVVSASQTLTRPVLRVRFDVGVAAEGYSGHRNSPRTGSSHKLGVTARTAISWHRVNAA